VGAIKERGWKSGITNRISAIFNHISVPRQKLKIWLMPFFALIWVICVQNFSSPALKLREEIEDDGHTYCKIQNFMHAGCKLGYFLKLFDGQICFIFALIGCGTFLFQCNEQQTQVSPQKILFYVYHPYAWNTTEPCDKVHAKFCSNLVQWLLFDDLYLYFCISSKASSYIVQSGLDSRTSWSNLVGSQWYTILNIRQSFKLNLVYV